MIPRLHHGFCLMGIATEINRNEREQLGHGGENATIMVYVRGLRRRCEGLNVRQVNTAPKSPL